MPLINEDTNLITSIPFTELGSDPTTPPSGMWKLYFKSGGLYVEDDAGNVVGPMSFGTKVDEIILADKKNQNVDAGTFTSGAWRVRDINTEVSDSGGYASIGSNQITLQAGTYSFDINCPAYNCALHQAKLVNVTDAIEYLGQSAYASTGVMNYSFIVGKFTIASAKVFEIQHRCSSTGGFGNAANFGQETYTIAKFVRTQ